jgi:hypothetical protein
MQALARVIMRGRVQAIMSVTVLAMFSLLLAPLSILSGAAVALVTLRHGAKEGMLVVIASWLASSLLSYLVFTDILPAAVFALVLWAPVWLLGLLLRFSRSLSITIETMLLLALIAVGILFSVVSDPAAYWAGWLKEPLQNLLQNSDVQTSAEEFETILQSVSKWMSAILAVGFFMQLVATLFIARWWQGLLYNPGGFGREFRELRYHQLLALMSAPVLLWVALGSPPDWLVAIATLLIAAYFLQGLAVTHGLLKHFNAHVVWLAGIYVMLFIALPYVMAALAVTGFTDAWMNFRKNVSPSSENGD